MLRNWKEDCTYYGRLARHWCGNALSVWRGRSDVAIRYTKRCRAAASVVKEMKRAGRKAIAMQADPRMPAPSKRRSTRPSLPSAD